MFIKEAWYVAGWSTDLDREARLAIEILSEPIMIYRGADGTVHCLEDRCCHRHAPLSMGKVEGNDIRCMYHGFKFDSGGKCVEIPGQKGIPKQACVRSYPVAERHGWLWVWPGDPALADQALIPSVIGADSSDYVLKPGSLDFQASAQLLSDNLLDFAHFSYVHQNSFKLTEDWALSRPNIERIDRGLHIWRWVPNQPPASHQREEGQIDHWAAYDFLVPGIFAFHTRMYPQGSAEACNWQHPPENLEPISASYSIQAVTPTSDRTTRYFFSYGPRVVENVNNYAEAFSQVALSAFLEDKMMIEAQQRRLDSEGKPFVIVNSDSALVQYRRLIEEMAEAEPGKLRTLMSA